MTEQPAEHLARIKTQHPLWSIRHVSEGHGWTAHRPGRSPVWAGTLADLEVRVHAAEAPRTTRAADEGHTATGGAYDMNVGAVIADYPDFWIGGGFEGFGYRARRRDASGPPSGPDLTAASLDELASLMDAARLARSGSDAGLTARSAGDD
jgi:hypothetical protein